MKIRLVIITVLALGSIAAQSAFTRLAKFTVINKSGMDLGLLLTNTEDGTSFYLTVPPTSAATPEQSTYALPRAIYTVQAYYLEIWDPVYGYTCDSSGGQKVDLSKNSRLVVLPCTRSPSKRGDPSMYKLGGGGRGRR